MRSLLSAALVALLTTAAHAQPGSPCSDADRAKVLLEGRHGERVVAMGMTEQSAQNPAAMMRLWASPDGSSWTLTVTAPNARMPSGFATCLVGSGTVYRSARIERGDQS